jgi:hypothetical protein
MKNLDFNKYTPIKDRLTHKPIFLGDYVENEKGNCGVLIWDEYMNRYLIRSESGGNIYARQYKKINILHENKIDTTKIECRKKQLK